MAIEFQALNMGSCVSGQDNVRHVSGCASLSVLELDENKLHVSRAVH